MSHPRRGKRKKQSESPAPFSFSSGPNVIHPFGGGRTREKKLFFVTLSLFVVYNGGGGVMSRGKGEVVLRVLCRMAFVLKPKLRVTSHVMHLSEGMTKYVFDRSWSLLSILGEGLRLGRRGKGGGGWFYVCGVAWPLFYNQNCVATTQNMSP